MTVVTITLLLLLSHGNLFAHAVCVPSPLSEVTVPVVPNHAFAWRPPHTLRPQIGRSGTNSWAMFSNSQVQKYGLWCQVRVNHTAGMANNIGNWYYPKPTRNSGLDYALAPPLNDNSTVPYKSIKCTNQIGLLLDGSVESNQGLVMCRTTVPNLFKEANFFGVYSDRVFNSYTGPTVDPAMKFSLLSSRDADSITFSLSFNVSFGPPSYVQCSDGTSNVFSRPRGQPVREVIRPHYVSSSQPDKTRVIVNLASAREARTYTCTVIVEGRVNVGSRGYNFDPRGTPGKSTTSITVLNAPTAVTVSRISTSLTSVLVSWAAPEPQPYGYEVFYQATGSSRLSGRSTSDSELILTGLTLGETYSIFVVSFGAEGVPVFPSPHSDTKYVTLSPGQVTDLSASPGVLELTISWTPFNESSELIIAYEVGYNSSGEFSYTNTTATQYTLRDIPPSTVVAYSTRVYTIVGPGDSISGQVSTESIPPISQVSIHPVSESAVNVSWEPVNLPVHHYIVHYRNVGDEPHDQGMVMFPHSVSHGVVDDLKKGEQYQFSVSVSVNVSGQIYTGPLTFSQTVYDLIADTTTSLTTVLIGSVGGCVIVVLLTTIVVSLIVRRLRHVISMRKPDINNPVYGTVVKVADVKMTDCAAYGSVHYQNEDDPIYDIIV